MVGQKPVELVVGHREEGIHHAEWFEDLVVAAFNDAHRKIESTIAEKFSGLASGMSLPPGMKLPF